MTTVLKLGGSVITDKTEPETVDHSSLRTAAVAIGTTDDLVVVHGGGSFGHHHAAAHGVT
ncbi:MAG: acetylglutamate kinase, partial [Natronomonas sp.]